MSNNKPGSLKPTAKTLLRNVIRHTDSHNRLREEAAMWQVHSRMKNNKDQPKWNSDKVDTDRRTQPRERTGMSHTGDLDVQRSFLYDDRSCMSVEGRGSGRRAHMDTQLESGGGRSTFWMRQLERAEQHDPLRWGHAGYKELYPEDFDSDKSDETQTEHIDKSLKHKRGLKDKKKSSHKLKKKKTHHRKRRRKSSDSGSDSDQSEPKRKRRKRDKRREKRKRVEALSSSDSDESMNRTSKFDSERNDIQDEFRHDTQHKRRKRK